MQQISNSAPKAAQARNAENATAFLSQDHGENFAKKIADARPVNEGGVTWGYLVTRRRPKKANVPFSSLRSAEIERLALHRLRYDPPSPEGERRLAIAIAHHARPDDARAWIGRWCANISDDERDEIVWEAEDNRHRWSAADLGEFLGMTRDERERLRISTFRAEGQTKNELTLTRKRKARERMRLKRAAEKAADPRPVSIEKAEPWKAEGISRRTWYRRQEAARKARAEAGGTTFVRSTTEGRGENEAGAKRHAGGSKAAAKRSAEPTANPASNALRRASKAAVPPGPAPPADVCRAAQAGVGRVIAILQADARQRGKIYAGTSPALQPAVKRPARPLGRHRFFPPGGEHAARCTATFSCFLRNEKLVSFRMGNPAS